MPKCLQIKQRACLGLLKIGSAIASPRESRNRAKHPTVIDDSFHRRRHGDYEIEVALVFSIPRGVAGTRSQTRRKIRTVREFKAHQSALCKFVTILVNFFL